MLKYFGVDSGGMVSADSSAALAIAKRKGAGKLRHININCLWIQEKQDTKQVELRKVVGAENPAYMMTKHLPRQSLEKCMSHLNQYHVKGRAKSGLDVQGSKSAEKRSGVAHGGPPEVSPSTSVEAVCTVTADEMRVPIRSIKFQ